MVYPDQREAGLPVRPGGRVCRVVGKAVQHMSMCAGWSTTVPDRAFIETGNGVRPVHLQPWNRRLSTSQLQTGRDQRTRVSLRQDRQCYRCKAMWLPGRTHYVGADEPVVHYDFPYRLTAAGAAEYAR
jgi:hypothetical protein